MRVDPRVARSRAKTLQSAAELLIEGGVRAVTMDAIAERSGVSKSTMYRHFPSRTALVITVLRHGSPNLDIEIPPGNFDDGIRGFVTSLASSMADPELARLLPELMSLKNTMPDAHALVQRKRGDLFATVQTIVDRGTHEGLLPTDTDVATTLDLLVGPLVLAVINDETERLTTIADEVSDRYLASCRQLTPTPCT